MLMTEGQKDTEVYRESTKYFIGNLDDQTFQEKRGYFVGFFMKGEASPYIRSLDILVREDVECAVMVLPEIDLSPPHYHKLAMELTYCISGRLHMKVGEDEFDLLENQFMVIPPEVVSQNPSNATGTKIFVVKVPSVPDDKFYV